MYTTKGARIFVSRSVKRYPLILTKLQIPLICITGSETLCEEFNEIDSYPLLHHNDVLAGKSKH